MVKKISKTVKKNMAKIVKSMKFDKLMKKYPETSIVMMKYGLHCVGCGAASFETIEQGAKGHGMNDEEMNKMIREMNNLMEGKNVEEKIEEKHSEVIKEKVKKKSFLRRLLGLR